MELKDGIVLQIDEVYLVIENDYKVRISAMWDKAIFHEVPLHPMGRQLAEESSGILQTSVPLLSAPFLPPSQPISPYGNAQLVPLCTLAATTDATELHGAQPLLYEVWRVSVHSVVAQELVWPKCKCGSKFSIEDKTCAKTCSDATMDRIRVFGTVELAD